VNRTGSLAVGIGHTASGVYSVAFGELNKALGYSSLAQGGGTLATSWYAHAEGVNTTAVDYAHSEGQDTKALSQTSHAEGYQTTAKAFAAHAEGYGTIASANYQHVQGQWNREDTSALFVIGDGTSNGVRSNVVAAYTDKFTVSGSLNVSGSITLNGSAITAGGGTSPKYFTYSGSHLYTTAWQTVNIPLGTVSVDTTKKFKIDLWGFNYYPDDFFGETFDNQGAVYGQPVTLWSDGWGGQKQVFNLGTSNKNSGYLYQVRVNYPGSGSNLQFQWKASGNMALSFITGVGGTLTYL
jgi:phage baseplate assembly protein gpV